MIRGSVREGGVMSGAGVSRGGSVSHGGGGGVSCGVILFLELVLLVELFFLVDLVFLVELVLLVDLEFLVELVLLLGQALRVESLVKPALSVLRTLWKPLSALIQGAKLGGRARNARGNGRQVAMAKQSDPRSSRVDTQVIITLVPRPRRTEAIMAPLNKLAVRASMPLPATPRIVKTCCGTYELERARTDSWFPESCCSRTFGAGDGLGVRAIAASAMAAVKRSISMRREAAFASDKDEESESEDLLRHCDTAYRRETATNSGLPRRHRLEAGRDHNRAHQQRFRTKWNRMSTLKPVNDSDRAKALERLQKALGPDSLDECVCVACDQLVLRYEAERKEASDWTFMNKMRRSLGELDMDLPRALQDWYRAPACVTFLRDVIVAPNSFRCYTGDEGHLTAWFTVCKTCLKEIDRDRIPTFAIANGVFVGSLPDDLQSLTLPERMLTQLVTVAAMTRVMRGGRHRCIRSHCIAFDCTPSPPVMLLPRSISSVDAFRVAMVGDFTDEQVEKVKAMHQIRTRKLQGVFDFYKRNNCLYSDVVRNDGVLADGIDTELLEHLILNHIENEGGAIDDSVREDLENIRGHSDAWQVENACDELSVVERRIGLSDAAKELLSREHSLASHENGTREFLVKRSNKISGDASGDLLARMFPHLFPFGHGYPGEPRQVTVSLQECVKHYIMLSRRRFAEDELFTLVSFDRISMKNMYTQNSIRCLRFPGVFSGFEAIGPAELGGALLENEQRQQGRRSGRTEHDSVAHKFLKTVEIASAAVWGSNAERAKCRQKAFAYQRRFGQPSLFITLTPNTDNSLVMAHYAGIASIASLFDILEARTPSKAQLREASMGNDCASARLFMRSVDVFIRHVLGVDPATRQRMPFSGLIGEVRAYFGMGETQGRGTLHIHMLVWLVGAPSSTVELESLLRGPGEEQFKETVESYVRSIVSNDLPLPVERFTCSLPIYLYNVQ